MSPEHDSRNGRAFTPSSPTTAARPVFLPSFSTAPAAEPRPAQAALAGDTVNIPAAELEALRQRARAEGFDAGVREGRTAAYAEWNGRLGVLATALEAAAKDLLARRVELAAEVDRQAPRMLSALARKVIQRELAVSDTAMRTVVRGVTERLAGCGRPVTVRLSPQSVEAFGAWQRSQGDERRGAGVRVEADASLGPGDWMIETNDGFLDGRVDSQLDEAWTLVASLTE